MIVAFGPKTNVPSWQWVGEDTSKELSKYYDIKYFESFSNYVEADVIVVIKKPPSGEFLQKNQKSKIIYCPIDNYEAEAQIQNDANMLRRCDLILAHCSRLIPYLSKYSKTYFVEHHGKYTLSTMSNYKTSGYVLWIGGFQFTPYILQWLEEHPLRTSEIKYLTDYRNQKAVRKAKYFAERIKVKFNYNNLDLYEWSEELQTKMLHEAKAAIDIKGDDFQQLHKPPTKAQKFICSGVPLAMNRNSASSEYFRSKGFFIASPIEEEKWFSKAYYNETITFGKKLKDFLTLNNIGKEYKKHIDSLKE